MMLPQSAPRTACAILVAWANDQGHWVRRLVGDVVATRQELPDVAVDEIYRAFLIESALADGDVEQVSPLIAVEGEAETLEALRLEKLSSVEGVNALAPAQEISFNPALTILFGENACGKTGYVRVLKTLAAGRTSTPVLGNVRVDESAAKRAQIAFRIGNSVQSHTWKGETGLMPFTRMSVFDSAAVSIHVDDDLSYSYTPSDLALFRYVTEAIEGIKRRLSAAQSSASSSTNPFLHRFERDTRTYTKVQLLGAATDMTALRSLANVSEEEELGLPDLRERVAALRPEGTQTKLQLARAQRALVASIAAFAAEVDKFDDAAYRSEIEAVVAATNANLSANERAFGGTEFSGVLSESWRAFIAAGEQFIAEHHESAYPRKGDHCVYCHQPLSEAAFNLLATYRALAHDTTKEALDTAAKHLSARQRSVEGIIPGQVEAALDRDASLLDGHDALLSAARALIESAGLSKDAVLGGLDHDFAHTRAAAATVLNEAQLVATITDETISALTQRNEERQRLFAEAISEQRDRESRILLRQLLAEMEAYVTRAKWVANAAVVGARFTPILKSLTEATKSASEGLLNDDFEERFAKESEALRTPKVRLNFPGKRGEPARRKSIVPKHKLSDILSEGEQKVIALADFLAEATLRRTAAPIVFDDPVNSLDYKRMEHVVKRIVELCADQQVIVFTHNIWFTVELLARFEKRPANVAYFDVEARDGLVGIITEGTHPRWDTPKEIEKRVNRLVQDMGKVTGETQAAVIERIYELIRNWCEAFVEQELLQGVSRRYQPNVMMNNLSKIRTAKLDATIAIIDPIYQKACRMIGGHSQPLETLAIRADPTELRDDWKALQDARDGYIK